METCNVMDCPREGTWYATSVPIVECDVEGSKIESFYLCPGHVGDLEQACQDNDLKGVAVGPADCVLIEVDVDA